MERNTSKSNFSVSASHGLFLRGVSGGVSNNWYTQMAGTLFHSATKKGVPHVRVRYNICIIIYLL